MRNFNINNKINNNIMSDNELQETTNFVYRITNLLEDDFKHIEQYLSREFIELLYKERENLVDEEQRRNI